MVIWQCTVNYHVVAVISFFIALCFCLCTWSYSVCCKPPKIYKINSVSELAPSSLLENLWESYFMYCRSAFNTIIHELLDMKLSQFSNCERILDFLSDMVYVVALNMSYSCLWFWFFSCTSLQMDLFLVTLQSNCMFQIISPNFQPTFIKMGQILLQLWHFWNARVVMGGCSGGSSGWGFRLLNRRSASTAKLPPLVSLSKALNTLCSRGTVSLWPQPPKYMW